MDPLAIHLDLDHGIFLRTQPTESTISNDNHSDTQLLDGTDATQIFTLIYL